MFLNHLKIALRNLLKNKLFAAINIAGLAIGLTIYVFGGLLIEYEQTHDTFFEKSERVYTIGSNLSEGLDVGVTVVGAAYSALGPIIEAELSDVEYVARTLRYEFLMGRDDISFYQQVRFSDPDLLRILDFEYLHGDETALDDPSGILITEDTAIKYFGDTNALGKTVTLDNEFDFRVTAVIRNLPLNSHFNSLLIVDDPFEMLAPLEALGQLRDYDSAGNWGNLSIGDMTYVLLPEHLDAEWLNNQLEGIYKRLVPDDTQETITRFFAEPLSRANLSVWNTIGLPVIFIIQLLSLLVLVVACVNYTNLATAQSLGRSREVGMRKTMGASRAQLLAQFLVESLTIASIAMLVAVATLEVVIPLFNNVAGKAMTIDYLRTLPWLIGTTAVVGLLAGTYPAWLITQANPIDALREQARRGRKGARVRAVMIGAQFAISAFMLAVVMVVFMQNRHVEESSHLFPRSQIYTLQRLNVNSIRDRLDTLRHELEALPGVEHAAFSSQIPYEQNHPQSEIAAKPGDKAGKFLVYRMIATPEFLAVYDIPLLAGRNLSRDVANDLREDDSEVSNVLVNEMTLSMLGFSSPAEAIGQRFYDMGDEDSSRELIIVGVVPTQNILGLYNKEKPWVFFQQRNVRTGSVRLKGDDYSETIGEIEAVWKRVIPDYPFQGRFLDGVFDDVYRILKFMNRALAGFAFVALALAMIGLFGLAAFMASQRTREIGMRKVLGASSLQIARLLVWQFSRPVLFALLLALPAAWFASNLYLEFFAERIGAPLLILLLSGGVAVLLAWGTVAGHAIRISRSNPILALRYE
ncbi:MAG: FtsX-like permease family protein [Xanthomonadales bacterium]|jgi:putative ABC transport system permease protein|nr:FtsX-like permease family protein [Xanthomonadales bacterium]